MKTSQKRRYWKKKEDTGMKNENYHIKKQILYLRK